MNEAEKMARLHQTMLEIDTTCLRMARDNRPFMGNALLNLALGYLIEAHGQNGTAALLTRVVGALAAADLPGCEERALDAARLDS